MVPRPRRLRQASLNRTDSRAMIRPQAVLSSIAKSHFAPILRPCRGALCNAVCCCWRFALLDATVIRLIPLVILRGTNLQRRRKVYPINSSA